MKLKFLKNKIEFKKELNDLDKFVVDFTSILNKLGINYVIVSGYVAILFGRNRTSEDVDIIMKNWTSKDLMRHLGKSVKSLNASRQITQKKLTIDIF